MSETGPPADGKQRRELAVQMAALGLEFSASVIGGLALGYYLDRWLGTDPWLLVTFTFGGMAGAMVRIVMLSRRFERMRREERP